MAMGDWQPIETAFEQLTFELIGTPAVKYYRSALVYGPTWRPNGIYDDWPNDGRGDWSGPQRFAMASTYEGKGFWTVDSDAPSEYDTHIQPTHWMPLSAPPAVKEA